MELENGLEREAFVTRTSCQLVSLRVLERIYGARSGRAMSRGPATRFAGARGEDAARKTLAYLTEKSSTLLPRHLNERKTSDGGVSVEERERRRAE